MVCTPTTTHPSAEPTPRAVLSESDLDALDEANRLALMQAHLDWLNEKIGSLKALLD